MISAGRRFIVSALIITRSETIQIFSMLNRFRSLWITRTSVFTSIVLRIELELPVCKKPADDLPDPQILPESFKNEGRTDLLRCDASFIGTLSNLDADMLLQRLMFVPVMRVRPVGMNMIFFKVLMFVNISFMNNSYVFVNMMNIVVIV